MSDWKETRTSARLRKTQISKGPSAAASGGSLHEETASTAPRRVTTPAPVDSSSPGRSYRVSSQAVGGNLRQVNTDPLQSLSHTKTSGSSGKRKPRNRASECGQIKKTSDFSHRYNTLAKIGRQLPDSDDRPVSPAVDILFGPR
jgi:hypothetical protein